MKKSILFLLSIIFIFTVSAQNEVKRQRAFDPQKKTERLSKALSLTQDQQPKILKLHETFANEMKAIRDQESQDRKEKMGEIKKLIDQLTKDIETILTPEQKEKFTKIQEEDKAKMEERRKEKRKENKE